MSKKQKIEFSNEVQPTFTNEDQTLLNNLIQEKFRCEEIIKKNNFTIEKLKEKKIKYCNHDLKVEREDGPYGERFTYCTKCEYFRLGSIIRF